MLYEIRDQNVEYFTHQKTYKTKSHHYITPKWEMVCHHHRVHITNHIFMEDFQILEIQTVYVKRRIRRRKTKRTKRIEEKRQLVYFSKHVIVCNQFFNFSCIFILFIFLSFLVPATIWDIIRKDEIKLKELRFLFPFKFHHHLLLLFVTFMWDGK